MTEFTTADQARLAQDDHEMAVIIRQQPPAGAPEWERFRALRQEAMALRQKQQQVLAEIART